MRKRLSALVDYFLSSIYLWLAGGAVIFLLYFMNLGSVPHGSIPQENPTNLGFNSVYAITNDIAFTPIKAAQFLALKFIEDEVILYRAVSAAVATASIALVFLILKHWHTTRIALITTFLYATSSFTLHHGRSSAPEVMYLLVVPALVLIGSWLIYKEHDNKLPLSFLLLGIIFYVPAAWSLVLFSIFLFRRELYQIVKQIPLQRKLISISVFLVTVTPLIYSLVTNKSSLLTWLGFNVPGRININSVGERVLSIPRELLISGPSDPHKWLVGTPMLDVFIAAVILLGLYSYKVGVHASREKVVISGLFTIGAVVLLGGTQHMGLLVPLLYIIAANGIAYLLISWFTVFPRNPLARHIGVILIMVAASVTSYYHIHRYFVAWPNSPQTLKSIQK